ncbi:MAG: hypothetical protein ACRCUF_17950 [Aeromonas sobria]
MAMPPPPKKEVNAKAISLAGALSTVKARTPLTAREDSTLVPLNFKVKPEFKRKLKMFAAANDVSMVEAMMMAVNEHIEEIE